MDATFFSFLDAWNRSQKTAMPALHERIARWFDERIAKGTRRMLLLAFRGAGKSTLLGLLAAWMLKCNPDRRILVLAAETPLAAKTVRTVRRVLERHPDTESLRPGLAEEWAADRLTVPRESVSRDPSLLARGIGANITGAHADVVICDDVEVPNTCGTPAKRADLRARLSEIDYVMSPGGFNIYSGTPHSYYSIYASEPRPEEGDERAFLQDFRRLEEPLTDHAWPERFPPAEIEAIRRHAGPARFASQMLLEPVQSVEGRLNAEWLRRYEGGLEYSEAGGQPVLRLEGRRLVSASGWWDPAYGKENKGDANVLAAVFTDDPGPAAAAPRGLHDADGRRLRGRGDATLPAGGRACPRAFPAGRLCGGERPREIPAGHPAPRARPGRPRRDGAGMAQQPAEAGTNPGSLRRAARRGRALGPWKRVQDALPARTQRMAAGGRRPG